MLSLFTSLQEAGLGTRRDSAYLLYIAKGSVIRNKRMVGEKVGGTCKTISHAQSGFED